MLWVNDQPKAQEQWPQPIRRGTTLEELRAIYGYGRYDPLATIKKRYDPRTLFRINHNILPS
jgi:hypothetical protein